MSGEGWSRVSEVIYEGNRTAHAPHNVLPSRQWIGGERTAD